MTEDLVKEVSTDSTNVCTSKVIVIGFDFLPDRISPNLKVGACTLTESAIGFQIDCISRAGMPSAFTEVVTAADAAYFESIKSPFPFVWHISAFRLLGRSRI